MTCPTSSRVQSPSAELKMAVCMDFLQHAAIFAGLSLPCVVLLTRFVHNSYNMYSHLLEKLVNLVLAMCRKFCF